MVQSARKIKSAKIILATIWGPVILVVHFWQWYIVNFALEALALIALWFFYLLGVGWSIRHMIRAPEVDGRIAAPFIVNAVFFMLMLTVPTHLIMREIDFRIKQEAMHELVLKVRSGEIDGPKNEKDKRQRGYRYSTSNVGDTLIQKEGSTIKVFFYIHGGALSGDSGFAYTSNDSLVNGDLDGLVASGNKVERLRENWYWVIDY